MYINLSNGKEYLWSGLEPRIIGNKLFSYNYSVQKRGLNNGTKFSAILMWAAPNLDPMRQYILLRTKSVSLEILINL